MQPSVFAYRGVPYASAERFGEPRILPFDPSKDYSERGPVCPQYSEEDNRKWGETGVCAQSEDCLVLSVYTPVAYGETVEERLPVFVYIHGGAYRHGGSEQKISDLQELAEREHIVCVSVSYRLGCFGYLYDPGHVPVNLALLDQKAALLWVVDNIGAFGGDPSRITLSGQSAGAQSVAFLLADLAEPMVQQALFFSAPLGLGLGKRRAKKMTDVFYRALGGGDLSAGRMALHTASTAELMAAQYEVEKQFRSGMAFQPVACNHLPLLFSCGLKRAVVTTQADDGSLYVPRWLRRFVTWYGFAHSSEQYVRYLAGHGVKADYHRFCWRAEGSVYGAAHCSELPCFAGRAENWPGAIFMGKTDESTIRLMRDAFIPRLARFIRTGEWTIPSDISTLIK